jgi:hydrogenase small subunit
MLVIEGSIPNEKIKPEGYWAAFGNDPDTGEPITTYDWVERLAPKALALIAAGTCATYGGIHAMRGNPTGAMGVADLLGWDFRTPAGIPIVNVPGCPTNPDNPVGDDPVPGLPGDWAGADDPTGREAAADLVVRRHGARELSPCRLLRAG